MNSTSHRIKEQLKQKFLRISSNRQSFNNPNIVKNHSSRSLDQSEVNLLSNGMNFASSHSKKDILSFISKVEPAISDLENVTNEEKIALRQRVVSSVNSAQTVNNLTSEEKQALQRLKDDDNIVIVPADKGKAIVVMDTEDYVNKTEDHLGNE